MRKKVLVSVSGGRTSAVMAKLLFDRFKNNYDLLFVFANTGREKEETLLFVNNITKHWGIPIVWVEAEVHHKSRKASTHKIVSFETANRDGYIFEEVIQKYGIPNQSFLHCTRELKTNPIRSYARSIGWGNFKNYTTAIGFRADEPKRINLIKAAENKQWYPLNEWGIKKPDVAVFMLKQDFDLGLEDHDGNCKKCYKKSDLKILKQVQTDLSDNWIGEIEQKYRYHRAGRVGVDPPYNFFRHHRTLNDIIEQYGGLEIIVKDKSLSTIGAEYDFDLNEQDSCAESCEPFAPN